MIQLVRFSLVGLLTLSNLVNTLPAIGRDYTGQRSTLAMGVSIAGRVKNEKGEPLPGVVISVQGKGMAATTNSAGSFLVTVDATAPVLQFSCAGYQPQTVPAADRRELTVTLYKIGVATSAEVHQAATEAAANSGIAFADELASFPGGETAYYAYLRKNSQYPEEAKNKNISGSVFVSFVVDEAGRILDAQVVKGVGYGLDEEALRLIRLMPWWTPGRQKGKAVRSSCTLRIKFEMRQLP